MSFLYIIQRLEKDCKKNLLQSFILEYFFFFKKVIVDFRIVRYNKSLRKIAILTIKKINAQYKIKFGGKSMKKIGIIGAMDEEVSRLKEMMKHISVIKKAEMDFYVGELKEKEVVVVKSGIGKVNAGICTQILIDQYQIEAVINTGVAGSLKNEINIGDIVLSTDTLYHDMDATGFGYKLGIIPRMETSIFQADAALLALAKKVCKEVNKEIQVFCGRVLSGDQFISDQEVKERLRKNFDGYCTEMEGAAIAHTAYLNQVPFLIIRAISDKADSSATVDYGVFEEKAIEHTVNLLLGMIEEL